MFRFLTACCAACLASGCFTSPAIYPENWAAKQASHGKDCPSVDGVFANTGDSRLEDGFNGFPVAEARSLAHILNGGTGVVSLALWNKLGDTFSDPERDPNSTVRLAFTDGRLHVTAAHPDGSSRSMVLPVQSGCRDGLLALQGDWDSDFELIGPPAPEFSRKSVALGRAGDGSLLLLESKTAVQWFLLTPAFGYSEAVWIRFEELPTSVASVAAGEKAP